MPKEPSPREGSYAADRKSGPPGEGGGSGRERDGVVRDAGWEGQGLWGEEDVCGSWLLLACW